MSTQFYVEIPKRTRNVVKYIAKKTGWTEFQCPETSDVNAVMTNGNHFIHLDRLPEKLQDGRYFALFERFGQNYTMGEELYEAFENVFSEHDDMITYCDRCQNAVLVNRKSVKTPAATRRRFAKPV